jgi:hypothetical protein
MVRCRKPPSQTWRTFLENHAKQLVSIDFFTVPTIHFQVLYVFLVLAHDRRRILHFNVTAHPPAEWTGQQLREAFPFDQLPRYLLRDRDSIFDDDFQEFLFRLLSPIENTSFAGERLTGAASDSAAARGVHRGGAAGRWVAPPLRTAGRLKNSRVH